MEPTDIEWQPPREGAVAWWNRAATGRGGTRLLERCALLLAALLAACGGQPQEDVEIGTTEQSLICLTDADCTGWTGGCVDLDENWLTPNECAGVPIEQECQPSPCNYAVGCGYDLPALGPGCGAGDTIDCPCTGGNTCLVAGTSNPPPSGQLGVCAPPVDCSCTGGLCGEPDGCGGWCDNQTCGDDASCTPNGLGGYGCVPDECQAAPCNPAGCGTDLPAVGPGCGAGDTIDCPCGGGDTCVLDGTSTPTTPGQLGVCEPPEVCSCDGKTCGEDDGCGTPCFGNGDADCNPGEHCSPLDPGGDAGYECTCLGDDYCRQSTGPRGYCDGAGGGDWGRCVCSPLTCAAVGNQCGLIADGCGGVLNCASNCGAGEVCDGGACVPDVFSCTQHSATLNQHVSAGRAYAEESSCGWSCTETAFFATGSGEQLGTSGSASVTLYQTSAGYYQTDNSSCGPVCSCDGRSCGEDDGCGTPCFGNGDADCNPGEHCSPLDPGGDAGYECTCLGDDYCRQATGPEGYCDGAGGGDWGRCVCDRRTCADYPDQCGSALDDGCGGTLDCSNACSQGACENGVCVGCSCTGKSCGEDDGCGTPCFGNGDADCNPGDWCAPLDPGGDAGYECTCLGDAACQQATGPAGYCDGAGGGDWGNCQCDLRTCADYAGQCGTLSNGCGGTITCGCGAGNRCTAGTCEPIPFECGEETSSLSQHEAAGRAYSEEASCGWSCTETTWYADGSGEVLGTSGSATATLYETAEGYWELDNSSCGPVCSCDGRSCGEDDGCGTPCFGNGDADCNPGEHCAPLDPGGDAGYECTCLGDDYCQQSTGPNGYCDGAGGGDWGRCVCDPYDSSDFNGQCGSGFDDGCGGTMDVGCGAGLGCIGGYCQPCSCDNRECGTNRCGDFCGSCGPNEYCLENNLDDADESVCVPQRPAADSCNNLVQDNGEEGVDCGGPCPYDCQNTCPADATCGQLGSDGEPCHGSCPPASRPARATLPSVVNDTFRDALQRYVSGTGVEASFGVVNNEWKGIQGTTATLSDSSIAFGCGTTIEPGGTACPALTNTLVQHAGLGRVYTESQSCGWGCTEDVYFAAGSGEELGTNPSSTVTLYETSEGYFETDNDSCSVQGSTQRDAFYRFEVCYTTQITIDMAGSTWTPAIGLFDGAGNYFSEETVLDCAPGGDAASLTVSLEPGTYWIILRGDTTFDESFSLYVKDDYAADPICGGAGEPYVCGRPNLCEQTPARILHRLPNDDGERGTYTGYDRLPGAFREGETTDDDGNTVYTSMRAATPDETASGERIAFRMCDEDGNPIPGDPFRPPTGDEWCPPLDGPCNCPMDRDSVTNFICSSDDDCVISGGSAPTCTLIPLEVCEEDDRRRCEEDPFRPGYSEQKFCAAAVDPDEDNRCDDMPALGCFSGSRTVVRDGVEMAECIDPSETPCRRVFECPPDQTLPDLGTPPVGQDREVFPEPTVSNAGAARAEFDSFGIFDERDDTCVLRSRPDRSGSAFADPRIADPGPFHNPPAPEPPKQMLGCDTMRGINVGAYVSELNEESREAGGGDLFSFDSLDSNQQFWIDQVPLPDGPYNWSTCSRDLNPDGNTPDFGGGLFRVEYAPKIRKVAEVQDLAGGEAKINVDVGLDWDLAATVWNSRFVVLGIDAAATIQRCQLDIHADVQLLNKFIDINDLTDNDIPLPITLDQDTRRACERTVGIAKSPIQFLEEVASGVTLPDYEDSFGVELMFQQPGSVTDLANRAKKALIDARIAKDYADDIKGRATMLADGTYEYVEGIDAEFCETTIEDLNLPPGAFDCTRPNLDFVNAWIDEYNDAVEAYVQKTVDILSDGAATVAGRGLGEAKLFDRVIPFEDVVVELTFPIGPISVVMEIAAGGHYGVLGQLEYQFTPAALMGTDAGTDGVIASGGMSVEPTAGAWVSVFVGAGIGGSFLGAHVGIEGQLNLVEVGVPASGYVQLARETTADEREITDETWMDRDADGNLPLNTLDPDRFAISTGHHKWKLEGTADLGLWVEALSGKIDARARIALLFYTIDIQKNLVKFDGIGNKDEPLTLFALDGTLGELDLGEFSQDIPLPYLPRIEFADYRVPTLTSEEWENFPTTNFFSQAYGDEVNYAGFAMGWDEGCESPLPVTPQ